MTGTLDMLVSGGPIIAVLVVLSLISLTVIVVKIIQLWHVGGGRALRAAALEQWKGGDRHGAQKALEGGRSPADRVTAYAMRALAGGFKGAPLEAELTRRGNEELAQMNRLVRLLEIIAMISPLLGLLGTVLGMIQSFQELALAEGAANASTLAGGIWQALLTTAAGLLVAIPAAVAAGLFAARIETAAQNIESAVGELMLADQNPNI
ncbi:MotA/TolQ/ExbB proton channel family protein [Seohaeicola nanhaiensis]|uniref:MotA/TolQ/ExbB proton channel family protein n=1 Tax=Seohaeicola nanhaiensis TaxID=1387282 RepID=A0ABV9KGX2_9RHOB